MQLIDIRPGDALWEEVWTVYEGSFPVMERRSAGAHARALSDRQFKTKIAVDDAGGLLGLLFYWDAEDYLYVEHLAVNPALRGRNIGSRLLSSFLKANEGRKTILEIDPPEDEISVRRLHFYERVGFVANDYHYIHPSFRSGADAQPHRLVLMSHPESITPDEFAAFERYVHERATAELD